jgi:hypothetical protein
MPTPFVTRWIPLAALAAMLAAGCSNDIIPPFDPSTQAKLRLVHATLAPGGQTDFLFDGARVTRLDYRETTAYIDVMAGDRIITLRGLPDQDGNPGPTFIEAPVTLTPGQFHSVVFTGDAANLTAITTTDGANPPAGNWSLRVMHAGQGTPALDLYVTTQGADLNAATPLVTGIDWQEVTDYQEIAAGPLQVRLTPTGTKQALISTNEITFQDGQVSVFYVLDFPTPGNLPFGLLLADGGDLE